MPGVVGRWPARTGCARHPGLRHPRRLQPPLLRPPAMIASRLTEHPPRSEADKPATSSGRSSEPAACPARGPAKPWALIRLRRAGEKQARPEPNLPTRTGASSRCAPLCGTVRVHRHSTVVGGAASGCQELRWRPPLVKMRRTVRQLHFSHNRRQDGMPGCFTAGCFGLKPGPGSPSSPTAPAHSNG